MKWNYSKKVIYGSIAVEAEAEGWISFLTKYLVSCEFVIHLSSNPT